MQRNPGKKLLQKIQKPPWRPELEVRLDQFSQPWRSAPHEIRATANSEPAAATWLSSGGLSAPSEKKHGFVEASE